MFHGPKHQLQLVMDPTVSDQLHHPSVLPSHHDQVPKSVSAWRLAEPAPRAKWPGSEKVPASGRMSQEDFLVQYGFVADGFATRDYDNRSEFALLVRVWCHHDLLSRWPALLLGLEKCTIEAHGLTGLTWLRQAALSGGISVFQQGPHEIPYVREDLP